MIKNETVTARAILFSICSLVTVMTLGCSQNSDRSKLRIYAAASSQEVVEAICRKFEQLHNIEVVTSFGGTSTLANQILNGAEADLFLSANSDWVAELENEELTSVVHNIASNQLVVIALAQSSAASQVDSLEDLQSDAIRRIAVADPNSVPAGIYARRALEAADIWETINSKCVLSSHVRQTLAHVESGAADVGIVYATDAKICSSAKTIIEIPPQLTGKIGYQLALMKNDNDSSPLAQKLFDYICSDDNKQVIAEHGFIVSGDAD